MLLTINTKAAHSTAKLSKHSLNMNIELLIKLSSFIMQGKGNSCEGRTRFFFYCFILITRERWKCLRSLEGLTCSGMSSTLFVYFWEMPIYVCVCLCVCPLLTQILCLLEFKNYCTEFREALYLVFPLN